MNASATHSNFEHLFKGYEDIETGAKVVVHGLGIIANITAICLAFTASSVWMGVLIYVVVGLLLGLLAGALSIYFCATQVDRVEAVGRMANATASRVRGWFGR